jgi:hypothetical protein
LSQLSTYFAAVSAAHITPDNAAEHAAISTTE